MTPIQLKAVVRLGVLLSTVCLLEATTTRAQSFRDDFPGTSLDPAWQTWVFTGSRSGSGPANHYSLTDSPGSLRYGLNPLTHFDGFLNGYQSYTSTYVYNPGLEIYRNLVGERWRLETKVTHYLPYTNGRLFSVRAYFGDGGTGTVWMDIMRGRDNAYNALRFSVRTMTGPTWPANQSELASAEPVQAFSDTQTVWLRIERDGGVLTGSFSLDGIYWNTGVTYDLGTQLNGLAQRVTLAGQSWFIPTGYADYDYVDFDVLPTVTLLGGTGDQRALAAAIAGGALSAVGYDTPNGKALLSHFGVLPPGTEDQPRLQTPGNTSFTGVAHVGSTIVAVGGALPPSCGTSDGAGGTEGKPMLARYDAAGVFIGCQGSNVFGYRGGEGFNAVVGTTLGSGPVAFATGAAENFGGNNYVFFLDRYTESGTLTGRTTEPGAEAPIHFSEGYGLTVLDGYVYVVGHSGLVGEDGGWGTGITRPVLMKYEATAATPLRVWKQRPVDSPGYFRAVAHLSGYVYAVGNTYISAGAANSPNPAAGSSDYLIEKYDVDGTRQWRQVWGGGNDDVLTGVVAVGKRLFAVGHTKSSGAGGADALVFEIDPANGNRLQEHFWGGVQDDLLNAAATDGKDLYAVGESRSYASAEGNAAGENEVVILRLPVRASDSVPEPDAGPSQLVVAETPAGALVTLDGSTSSDPDGDPLTYTWTGPFALNGGIAWGVSPSVTLPVGSHTITLTVSDGAATATDTVVIDVENPTLEVAKTGTGGGTVTSTPAGIDCGATCVSAFDVGTLVTLTAAPEGTSHFSGWGGACTGTEACVVVLTGPSTVTAAFDANQPPVAMDQSVTAVEDAPLAVTLVATDPDGPGLSYLVVVVPAHGALSGTAPNLTYTPSANYNGADSFTFKANDTIADSNEATVSMTVTAVNDAPVLTAPVRQYVSEGVELVFVVSATDVDGDVLVYSAVDVPSGASFDPETRTFTWTPTVDEGRTEPYVVTFTVTDGTVPDSRATSISVIDPGAVPGKWRERKPIFGGHIFRIVRDAGGVVYATSAGGVFKSTDDGLTWAGANGNLPSRPSGPIMADPGTAGVVYVWISEGLYRTSDGGTSWVRMGLNLPAGVTIQEMTVASTNASRLYVGAWGDYVWRSVDGGATWEQKSAGLDYPYVTAMAVDPTNPSRVWTMTWRRTLYRSENGGDTWTSLGYRGYGEGLSQIFPAPSSPDVLYATKENGYCLMRSADAGATWTNKGCDIYRCAADPLDENVVWVAGGSGIRRSTNGGDTWSAVLAPAALASMETVSLGAPGHALAGSYYTGLYRTVDDGATWEQRNEGLAATSMSGLDVVRDHPSRLYTSTVGGGFFRSTDGGGTWGEMGTAQGFADKSGWALGAHPSNPDLMVLYANDTQAHLWRTTDGGTSFTSASNYWASFIRFNPATPTSVVASTGDSVGGYLFSGNSGVTWANPQYNYTYPKDFTFHPSLPNVVFATAGRYTGAALTVLEITWSNDGGLHWTRQSVASAQFASDAALDQRDPTVLYVAASIPGVGEGVFKYAVSYSGGAVQSVTKVGNTYNTGLGSTSVSKLLYDAANGWLYAVAGGSVYRSADQAATWTHVGTGLPHQAQLLALAPDGSRLYAGTSGGIWEYGPNQGPTASDGSVTTDEDTPVAITLAATDPNGDPLTYDVVTSPAHGTLSGTAPDLTYAPAENYNGADTFTFKANDGTTDSNTATVNIAVTPVNDPPVAVDQAAGGLEDTPLPIAVEATDVDGDLLTYAVVSGPTNGSLSGAGASLTYTPALNYNGPDSFTWKASDGTVDSNVATASITVDPVNDMPVAMDQSVTAVEDAPLAVTLVATDPDGPGLSYLVVVVPAHGALSGTAPNLTYTPSANYNGADSFTFKANDTIADSNEATVSMTVTAVNDAPVLTAPVRQYVSEGVELVFVVSATDVDGDVLVYSAVDVPSGASFDPETRTFTWTPTVDEGRTEPYVVTFTVTDGTVPDSRATSISVIDPGAVPGKWRERKPIFGGHIFRIVRDAGGVVYATSAGGVFKSTDDGLTWAGANGNLPSRPSGPIMADPGTAGVVYVWISEGLYRTSDGGTSWVRMGLNLPAGVTIQEMTVASTNASRLYVGAWGDYVWRSVDGGATWEQKSAGLDYPYVTAMAVDPTNPSRVWTMTWRRTLYRSENGGDTWTSLGYRGYGEGLSQIFPAPSSPDVLYATKENGYCLMRSADAGATWTNKGCDIYRCAADPLDENVVWVAGGSGIRRSTNGGDTWSAVLAPAALASMETVSLGAPGHALAGSYYTGLYRTVDDGATWEQRNEGLAATSMSGLDVVRDHPSRLYTSTVGGGFFRSTDGGGTWGEMGTAQGFADKSGWALGAHPSNPDLMVLYANDTQAHLWRTTDGGTSFTSASNYWASFIRFNPATPTSVVASTGDSVGGYLFSGNSGVTWANPQYNYTYPKDFTFHPSLPNVVFATAGRYTGAALTVLEITWSNDGGLHWTRQSVASAQFASDAALDQRDPTVLYVAASIPGVGEGVFKYAVSYSGGAVQSVTKVGNTYNTGLGSTSVSKLLYDAANGWLYAVAGGSVYRSADQAATWTHVGTGLPHQAQLLALAPDGSRLYAGTSGGIWEYGPNQGPTASDGSVTTDEDTPVAITLAATDPNGDPLTYDVVTSPAHGTLSGTAPDLTYAPAENYNGADTFTFKANDGTTDSNTATVSLTVNPVTDVYLLSIEETGDGLGTVTSDPVGIDCGIDCTENYDEGTSVTLTATPAAGSAFTGWSGACTGTGSCQITMSAARSVTATFAPLSLSINDTVLNEGNSGTTPMTFTVSLSVASAGTVTVDWATSNGTATAGEDYVSASGTLTFDPGQTSQPIPVTVNGDTTYEPDETFTVTLSGPLGATIAHGQGLGTITNDDTPPVIEEPVVWTALVGVTATGNSLTKTAGAAWGNAGAISTQQLALGDGYVEITASETTTNRMFGLSNGNSNANYADIDFGFNVRPTAGIQVYEGGILRGTFGTYVSGDKLRVAVEGGVVKYRKNGALLYTSGVAPTYPLLVDAALLNQTATITSAVVSNWSVGALPTLSISDASVSEGNSGTVPATFTVSLSAVSAGTVTVSWATSNGLATAGEDYVAASDTLTFSPGQTSLPISVTVNGDTTYEPDETFTVTLSGPSDATLMDGQGLGTITNDDTPPVIEEPVVWTALVGVSATGNSLTKTAATGWGNAGAISTQQLASGDGYVEITASETTTNRMFGLSNGNSNANYTGIDFGLNPRPGAGIQVYEGGILCGTFGTYISGDKLRVAVEGGVVKYRKNGALLYTSPVAPTYPLLVDTALLNQTATITSAVVSNWSVGALPTLSISDANVSEGNSGPTTATFTVSLSAASVGTVTVSWATSNGTATAGEDYVAASDTLTFDPGQTSLPISVTVNGDTTYEPDETFAVTLSGPSGATLTDGQSLGTITNDDTPPVIEEPVVWTSLVGVSATGNSLTKTATATWGNGGAISTQQLASGDGYVEITASETTTNRMFGLSNGNSNANYTDIDFGFNVRPGAGIQVYEGGILRGTFGTYVSGDRLRVAVEGGVVKYRKSGALLYTSGVAPTYPLLVDTALLNQTATISSAVVSNWTLGAPTLSISDVNVSEGNSGTTTATFTVSLSATSVGTVTVDWATSDGTAVAGEDYVAASGTLTFNSGQTSQPIPVTVNGDVTYEPDETFTVTLSSPVGATIADGQGLGRIINDDTPPVIEEPVVWTSLVGVTPTGNSLTKTASAGWGNAGAISTQQLASGDGYVEITASETTTNRMFGLSNGNSNANYTDIDFGFNLRPAGAIQVYEGGILRGTFGTYVSGDKLQVAVEGGVVKYRKNGALLYTSLVAPTYPLLVDTALYNQGATLTDVMISQTP